MNCKGFATPRQGHLEAEILVVGQLVLNLAKDCFKIAPWPKVWPSWPKGLRLAQGWSSWPQRKPSGAKASQERVPKTQQKSKHTFHILCFSLLLCYPVVFRVCFCSPKLLGAKLQGRLCVLVPKLTQESPGRAKRCPKNTATITAYPAYLMF